MNNKKINVYVCKVGVEMKMVRICLLAVMFASTAFAVDSFFYKSHYWGIHFSLDGITSTWNDKPVNGIFGQSSNSVESSSLLKKSDVGAGIGAAYWYVMNNKLIGFTAEANLRYFSFFLNNHIYNRPLNGEYKEKYDYSMSMWGFDFPLLVRFTPYDWPSYFEVGAQFNLNMGGSISNKNSSRNIDVEQYGWSLVFGVGFWYVLFESIRIVIDMNRIEKDRGIVEIQKGVAYRESSPARHWSFQLNFSFYNFGLR